MTAQLSREQLLSDIEHAEEKAATLCGACAEDHARLAGYMRMLLAGMSSEPVAWTSDNALSDVAVDMCGMLGPKNAVGDIALYTAPPATVADSEYGDAYQGAREDLSIWKRRALEAEGEVRRLVKINDYLVKQAQGESRMGEPLIRETAPMAVPDDCVIINKGLIHRLLQPSETSSIGCKVCISDDAMQAAKDIFNACRATMQSDVTLINEGNNHSEHTLDMGKAEPVTVATVPDGWTANADANAALVMLDRIDTIDCADDERIESVKSIIRRLAAAPEQEV